jgi:hypothetical protein
MESQTKLGRLLGVEIGLHYRWFVIAFLITFSLASHYGATQPHWGDVVTWAAAFGDRRAVLLHSGAS